MVLYHRTEGFILKKEDRGEADRVFSIFTKEFGKVLVFGKSIRKIDSKLRGGMEIFSFAEIEFVQGKHRKTLTETFSLEKFSCIKNDPHRFTVANHVASLLNRFLAGEERDEAIWSLLTETLSRLNEENLKIQTQTLLYYYFLWNLIVILGYQPELTCCANCHKKLEAGFLHFSFEEGGMVCQDCIAHGKSGIKVGSDLVKVLRLFVSREWTTLSRLKIDAEARYVPKEISKKYAQYLLERHGSREDRAL